MQTMKRAILILLALFLLNGSAVLAQDGSDNACPILVEQALTRVGETCKALGRNEACYGHNAVRATTWDSDQEILTEPGAVADVMQVATLTTMPMDILNSVWGIALLSLQADIPEALPGQAVTFIVYGDTALQNAVEPDTVEAPPPTCDVSAGNSINVRGGPGTGYAVLGSLSAGEAVTASGRNAAGDWVRFDYDGQNGWLYLPLLATDCDALTLDMVEGAQPTSRYTAPMQAFYLTTGLGDPPCAEAPRDGLLIQAPQDTTVHFLINGVEVAVGSTALLQVADASLNVNTFAGSVDVTSAGETQTVEPGYHSTAAETTPPTAPEAYNLQQVGNAPVDLLPEPVKIPPPAGTFVHAGRCAISSGSEEGPELQVAPAGQPLILYSGWGVANREIMDEYLATTNVTLALNGEPVELWQITDPETTPITYQDEAMDIVSVRYYWVLPEIPAGAYHTQVSYNFSYPLIDGIVDEDNDGVFDTFDSFSLECDFSVQ